MPAPPTTVAMLRLITDAETVPVLSADDLEALLAQNVAVDGEGRAPTADGWTPTYHMGKAAAAGWRIKAGKVANRTDAQADGGSLKRSQLFAHCMAMARAYAAQGIEAVNLGASTTRTASAALPVINLPESDYGPVPGWPGGAQGPTR